MKKHSSINRRKDTISAAGHHIQIFASLRLPNAAWVAEPVKMRALCLNYFDVSTVRFLLLSSVIAIVSGLYYSSLV
jgi:hypothetical protein